MTSTGEPAGVWLRVSTADQSEINQVPDVERHCQDRGYRVMTRYELNDFSAYHGEQEQAQQQAIADVRDGKIKVLVCWHSDRLERRGGLALLQFIAAIRDAGGRVESKQQPELGQANFSGRIVTFISGEIDHEKSAHIGEQVRLAIARIKANGGISNNIPWGFDTVGDKYSKRMVPTAYCREYAPQIFARCIAGDSLRKIAAWLDTEGVPTKRGGRWNESAVRWIIRNRAYAGRYLSREGKTIQEVPRVVEPNIFDRANAALKSRPKRGGSKNPPLLAKLKCPFCGSPMYRIRSGSTIKRLHYRCFGSGPQRKGCGNMVPLEKLDDLIIRNFSAWDKPHQTRQWIEGQNWESEISEVNQDIAEISRDILADGAIERLTEKREELARLTELNEHRELGRWDYANVLMPDGSIMTKGQFFSSLDEDGRREYLKTHDIRAFRTERGGIVALIDTQGAEQSEATAVIVDSAETLAELQETQKARP